MCALALDEGKKTDQRTDKAFLGVGWSIPYKYPLSFRSLLSEAPKPKTLIKTIGSYVSCTILVVCSWLSHEGFLDLRKPLAENYIWLKKILFLRGFLLNPAYIVIGISYLEL